MDQVLAAVAIEVDSEADIRCRQKLRLADFAGPAATELGGSQIALIDNSQRIQQLTGKDSLRRQS